MNKKSLQTLKAFCLLLAAIAFGTSVFAQGVSWSESFDGTTFAPTGWRNIPTIGGFGGALWSRQTVGTTPTCTPHSGAAMARFNSRTGATGATQTLVSPVVDYSNRGANTPTVSVWLYRDSAALTTQDSLTIYVNTADTTLGATRLGSIARSRTVAIPNTEAAAGWYQYTFNVPASFNTATNYLLFKGNKAAGAGGFGAGRYIFVDDINWVAYPPVCTGTPNVGNIVNSVTAICGGSGSSNLSLTSPITGASGITYQWQASTTGTSGWAPLTGSTNSPMASTGTISSTMYYQCVVTCSGSSLTYTTPLDSVLVSAGAGPTVAVTPNTITTCSGVATPITATGSATSFSWTPTTGLNNANAATVIATLTGNQNYVVTGYNAIGCQDTAHVTVRVNPSPNVTITSSVPNDTICAGTSVILSVPAAGGGGGGGTTYSWSNGPTTRRDTVTPTTTTTYIIIGTRGSCVANDTVKVVVNVGTPPTVTVNPTTTSFCGVTPVMLVASGTATSYSWTPANGLSTTTNDTVYAAPAGGGFGGTVYTVIGSNGICSASATVTVNRGTAPTGNITTNLVGDTTCTGGTVILTGPAGGGGGGATTYTWSNGSSTRRDTINAITTGGLYILTISRGGCSKIDTVNVTVILGTAPVLTLTPSGAASYCAGTSGLVLTAGGATTYTWAPPTGLSATTGSTVTATPAGGPPTVYTVTGSNGACSATATVTVTASNPPAKATITANPSDSVCAGTQVILRPGGFGGGGNTYHWSDGKTTRSDTTTIIMAGYNTVTVSNTAGCSTIDSIMMYLLPGITVKFGYTNTGLTYHFTDSTAGATAWNWSFGGGNTNTNQNPTFTFTAGSIDTVTLVATGTGGTGCNTGSKTVIINTATGIDGVDNNKINLTAYPNPANDAATVAFNVDAVQAQIVMMNTLGQSVMNKTIYPKINHNYNEKIALDGLSSGIYLIQIITANSTTSIKLIKE